MKRDMKGWYGAIVSAGFFLSGIFYVTLWVLPAAMMAVHIHHAFGILWFLTIPTITIGILGYRGVFQGGNNEKKR